MIPAVAGSRLVAERGAGRDPDPADHQDEGTEGLRSFDGIHRTGHDKQGEVT